MSVKSRIKSLIAGKPKKEEPEYGWSGNYLSWSDAEKECTGYDDALILEKCKDALLQVKNGEAVYERDSILFDRIQYSWPLLSALLRVALEKEGKLCVLDFGGSLGSSYFQNREYLSSCSELTWCIIEQQNFVDCGKKYFETDQLKFYPSVSAVISEHHPDIIIFSSVLQYLKDPYSMIAEIAAQKIPYVFVDHMPFNTEDKDRLTVQKVPPSIYTASYPCWFLPYKKVMAGFLESGYVVISEHESEFEIELDRKPAGYKGFLLKQK